MIHYPKRAQPSAAPFFFSLLSDSLSPFDDLRSRRQPLVRESVYTTFGVAFLRRGAQKRVGRGAVTPKGIYAIRMAFWLSALPGRYPRRGAVRRLDIRGPQNILIFGGSVEQGGVLYKRGARSRTSLSLSVLTTVVTRWP